MLYLLSQLEAYTVISIICISKLRKDLKWKLLQTAKQQKNGQYRSAHTQYHRVSSAQGHKFIFHNESVSERQVNDKLLAHCVHAGLINTELPDWL